MKNISCSAERGKINIWNIWWINVERKHWIVWGKEKVNVYVYVWYVCYVLAMVPCLMEYCWLRVFFSFCQLSFSLWFEYVCQFYDINSTLSFYYCDFSSLYFFAIANNFFHFFVIFPSLENVSTKNYPMFRNENGNCRLSRRISMNFCPSSTIFLGTFFFFDPKRHTRHYSFKLQTPLQIIFIEFLYFGQQSIKQILKRMYKCHNRPRHNK